MTLLRVLYGARTCVAIIRQGRSARLSVCFSGTAPFHSITDDDLGVFRTILGEGHVIQDPDVLKPRNLDWTGHFKGHAKLLLQPTSTEEVSKVLCYCHAKHLAVVPQGGQTGLVGGGVATGGSEILLSLERMNEIQHVNETTGVLRCQAGCVLQTVQEFCKQRGLIVPIDLGAKGSCQIGGNLSTNAGGQYFFRYGSLAGNVLGMQVVLADGRILDLNYSRPNMKDNTGYKLHQIFLGSEGTLGVITAAAVLCPNYPSSLQGVLLACDNFGSVLKVLRQARKQLGEILGALEFMDRNVVQVLHDAGHRIPLAQSSPGGETEISPYYLLVETHGSNTTHDREKMEGFLETLMGEGSVVDGALAQDETQREQFWHLREAANPTFGALGYGYKYDVSVPVTEWESFCEELRSHLLQHLPTDVHWVQGNWGHIMDGNLHWNLATPGQNVLDTRILEQVEKPLFERVLARGGSISAEHGLGQAKNRFLPLVHDKATLKAMKELKTLYDPRGILNPGKVLPAAL